MSSSMFPDWMTAASRRAEVLFERHGVRLAIGGEPTLVPCRPEGAEWSYAALGPTKLDYAMRLCGELIRDSLPDSTLFFSPGKQYPGEPNPRWALRILSGGSRPRTRENLPKRIGLPALARLVAKALGVPPENWARFKAPENPSRVVMALLLDNPGTGWASAKWPEGLKKRVLTGADGPAGLRLPLGALPPEIPRRALTLEQSENSLRIFFPPLLEEPFLELLELFLSVGERLEARAEYMGYVPIFYNGGREVVSVASDPGVLEINLPPCKNWEEYAEWLARLERCAERAGLRAWREDRGEFPAGTGGGHHLVFGPFPEAENHLLTRPEWLASMLAFWQHHPSLSYLFTGAYVGASSQAPRPDENVIPVGELALAFRQLCRKDDPPTPYFIHETVRHLYVDASGNPHRSEISFDKYFDPNHPAGLFGLLEFRAVETLPHAEWSAAVVLLWRSLAAHLLARPYHKPPVDFSRRLHDEFFLPTFLWADFLAVLGELEKSGIRMDAGVFRKIWEWKFPALVRYEENSRILEVRLAYESWPLLAEVPLDGGATSRFVDSSLRRLEFGISPALHASHKVRINGCELPFRRLPSGHWLAGLKYRHSNLYPSLHPRENIQLPLRLELVPAKERTGRVLAWELPRGGARFEPVRAGKVSAKAPVVPPAFEGAWTHDLRGAAGL